MDAQQTPSRRNGTKKRNRTLRHDSNAAWQEYRAEVYELYLDPDKPLSLEQLRRHFKQKYGFEAR
jgi:hypothetical protein